MSPHRPSVKITFPDGLSYEQPTGLFINNEFINGKLNGAIEVLSPSTETKVCDVAEAREEDIDIAVDAAEAAFNGEWAEIDPLLRGKMLTKLADLIEEQKELIAHIETLDNGKSLMNARDDIDKTYTYLRSCAGWADKVVGSAPDTGPTHLNIIKREPLGVCGQIIPWNFPLLMFSWKIGPAVVTGNTVVIKPAETTPLSALYAAKLIKEAGFPPGVINVVPGYGKIAGNAITHHRKIHKVAFTGSTSVGRQIMKAAAETNLKKVSLELGGKSPNIVFNDADIQSAVYAVTGGIFWNSGEICSAGSRVYVQSGVYDQVLVELRKAAESLKVGNPFDEDTFMGAQNSSMQLDKIMKYIELGKSEGAQIVTGGERIEMDGYFIKPTIFSNIKQDLALVQEEIFGPVVTVIKFDTDEEAIKLANDSVYGLASGIHTASVSRAIKVSNKIKAGTVWVNCFNDFNPMVPFGGYNQSGFGRDMGAACLDNYTQEKSIRILL